MNQIKLLEKTWKAGMAVFVAAVLAFGGLFLNLGAADAHGNPNMTADLRVSEVENPNQGWVDGTLTTQAGRTVKFDVEIHNTVVGTNAHNVRARINLPSSVSTSHNIPLTVWAENSNTASDSVTVSVPSPGAEIRYIAGSSRLTWDENGDGTLDYNQSLLPDDIVSSSGVRIGDQSGCNEFIIKINFLAQLVGELPPPPPPPPQEGQIKIVKFHDRNGDGDRDSGEEGLTWSFDVDGPESADFVKTTASDGTVIFAIPTGQTTVKEQTRAGWQVTTASSQTVTVATGEIMEVAFGNKQEEVVPPPPPPPPAGGQTQSQSQTQNVTQTQTNNQTVNVTTTTAPTGQVAGAKVPAKQPDTGVGVLGMISMFSVAPLGFMLARYGRGRASLNKRDEELMAVANSIFSQRQSRKTA